MDYTQFTDKALRQEIYRTRRELRESLKGVRALVDTSPHFPRYSLQHMTRLERQMREKAVKYMDRKELLNTLRDLTYVQGLKSSTVEGVTEMSFALEPIKEDLKAYSKTKQKEFWDIYGKIYQLYHETSHFKYEINTMAFEYFIKGGADPNLLTNVEELLKQSQLQFGGFKVKDADFKVYFTEGLRKIFQIE